MSFSGQEDCLEKAMNWINQRFGQVHINLPSGYEKITQTKTARNVVEILRTVEVILADLNTLFLLMLDESKSIPVEVSNGIFRALRLTQEEQKEVLHLVIDPAGIKIEAKSNDTSTLMKF